MQKRLFRSRKDRVLAGVAGGLAAHLNTDPVIIRVAFVALSLVGGGGLLAYIIMWAIIPEEAISFTKNDVENTFDTSNAPDTTDLPTENQYRSGSVVAGTILIIIGGLFLADEFLPNFAFQKYWPLLLVGLGIVILLNAGSKTNKS
ncbi:MAG: PspC domain-containing protein [Bacteroidia bacterium]